MEILAFQFLLSGIVISLIIFQISTREMILFEWIFSILYLSYCILELFLFCVSANEVTDKVMYFQ